MSDYMAAYIDIGGDVPRSLLPQLVEAAQADGLDTDWGASAADEDTFLSAPTDAPLRLYNEEARYGFLDMIESFCREHGITYRRHSAPKYEYAGSLTFWKPGMEKPSIIGAEEDGSAYLLVNDLMKAHEAGKTLAVVLAEAYDRIGHVPPLRITPADPTLAADLAQAEARLKEAEAAQEKAENEADRCREIVSKLKAKALLDGAEAAARNGA